MLTVDATYRAGSLDMSFAFSAEDGITGVFGRSGAGKTTLLHLIAGLLRPSDGRIGLNGTMLFDGPNRIDVPAHRRRIGVVFQDDRLLPHYSVRGNLTYGARRRGAAGESVTLDEIVDLLDLAPLIRRRVRELSGGERQRVALGRAVLSRPQLLLFDEPLSSLDRELKRQTLELIARVERELRLPMLYVSHDLTELLQLTDRLLIVDAGRTIAHGSLREVVRHGSAWTSMRGLHPVNVLPARVVNHDAEGGMTTMRAGEGDRASDLRGPLLDRPINASVHVSIRPEDVALASHRIADISIQNQVRGRITELTHHADCSIVEIDIGAPLLVEVSHKAAREMQLAAGLEVWCLIKANAIEYAA